MLLAGILMPTTSFAQSSAPYNPDGNGDGMIGVTDLQDFLSTYGLAFEATQQPIGLVAKPSHTLVWVIPQSKLATSAGLPKTSAQQPTNGDAIPQNLGDGDWSSTTSGAMAFYVNGPAYGGLYNWKAVEDPRGLVLAAGTSQPMESGL